MVLISSKKPKTFGSQGGVYHVILKLTRGTASDTLFFDTPFSLKGVFINHVAFRSLSWFDVSNF